MKEKVYVSEPIHERGYAILEKDLEVVRGNDLSRISEEAKGCSAILVRSAVVTAEIMDAVPTLRVIAKHGMGVDNIDVKHATEKGILVVNAPLSNLNSVAEHIVMLVLSLAKRTPLMDCLTKSGEFKKRTAYVNRELKGATLGMIGFGRIPRLTARRLGGFDMRLIAYDPFLPADAGKEFGVTMVSEDEVLAQSDFVVVHTQLNESTRHLMNGEKFSKMKPDAYFINACRGPVVDTQALVSALKSGKIAGAGLDVFDPEPPMPGDPLFAMDNVVLSPHNAALTDGALVRMAEDSAQGIADYLNGLRPAYPVNPEVLRGTEVPVE